MAKDEPDDASIGAILVGDARVGKRTLTRRAGGGPGPREWCGYGIVYAPENEQVTLRYISVNSHPPDMHPNDTLPGGQKLVKKDCPGESKNVQLTITAVLSDFLEHKTDIRGPLFLYMSVIAVCYRIDDRNSLENAIHKWFPMVRHFQSSAPILLIGCKSDSRDDASNTEVNIENISEEEGKRAAREAGATKWLECTSTDEQSIQNVAQWLAWYGYHYTARRKKKMGCIIS